MQYSLNVTNIDIIDIETVPQYLKIISELRHDEDDNQTLFFRGQEKDTWSIYPSIFRNNLLQFEDRIIRDAYASNPQKFSKYTSSLEKLTTLQHYNLCTRLLDVTLNPLVALYFACQKLEIPEGKYEEAEVTNRGLVFCHKGEAKNYDDVEVRILSTVAETRFQNKTISEFLNELTDKRIITSNEADLLKKDDYSKLIAILQSNYFVLPNSSNERLVRQSGAFIIAGGVNVLEAENGDNRKLQKAKISLDSEFKIKIIGIPEYKKDAILDELCLYNIHEGSLFPEFEHQMHHIKTTYQMKQSNDVDTFHPFDSVAEEFIRHHYPLDEIQDKERKLIVEAIRTWKPEGVSAYELYEIFDQNIIDGWYDNKEILDKIRSAACECIKKEKFNYPPDAVEKSANILINMISQDVKEGLKRN